MLTWQRAELSARVPWEVPEPFFSSYLGQGQPYQTTGPRGLLPPPSISLPPEEKGQPSLPPLFHLEPSSPPLRPSALHLSRGSLQSQDNLETSAGSLPETLKKFPPSLLLFSLSLSILTSPVHPHPTSLPLQPSSCSPGHYSIFSYPRPLFSLLPFIFRPFFFAFSASSDCD